MSARVVLAYSGGLRASVAVPWIADTHRAQVVAVAIDLGQGEDLADVRHRATAAGALRCHVIDARDEFARDFVVPSLKAGALLEGRYPPSTALGRALIAKTLVTVARVEETKTVAHAGSDRDHARIASAVRDIDPSITVIGCAQAWSFSSSDLESVAERQRIAFAAGGTHVDQNLWGRTVGRSLEVDAPLPDDLFSTTRAPGKGPNQEAMLEIEFQRGVPTALNGVTMPPSELIESLATIGAAHAIGRLTRVKGQLAGKVSYAVYEAPAAMLLHSALDELQRTLAPGAVQQFVPTVASAYADVIDRGEWFSNLRPALDAFVTSVQQGATGVVRLTLFQGGVTASGVRQLAATKP
jgi:argininosuccinate synthase